MAKPKGENSNQPRLPTLLWSFGGPATRSPYRRRVAEPEEYFKLSHAFSMMLRFPLFYRGKREILLSGILNYAQTILR
jgi:hypothetical protein